MQAVEWRWPLLLCKFFKGFFFYNHERYMTVVLHVWACPTVVSPPPLRVSVTLFCELLLKSLWHPYENSLYFARYWCSSYSWTTGVAQFLICVWKMEIPWWPTLLYCITSLWHFTHHIGTPFICLKSIISVDPERKSSRTRHAYWWATSLEHCFDYSNVSSTAD